LHYIFDLGLTLVEPLRKYTLDKLLEKAKSAPAMALNTINKQIEEVKNIPIVEFLNATYGKVLKDALVKKGFSATLLNGFKKQLMKDRGERRKKEREEFKIRVNEFEEEDIDQLKLDLFELVDKEYEENIEKNFKGYVRNKIIDIMFQK
jgi:aspartate/glutamate racemase